MKPEPTRRAVVCLAAGVQQLPVIRKARALGYAVVAVDRDARAPGFAECDHRLVLSTHDPAPVVAGLGPISANHRFAGVLVRSSGPPVVTAAEICRALGLPGVPPDSARTLVDKERMQKACKRAGVPVPSARSGARLADVAPDTLPFPCVVKPTLCLVGKAAVRVVHEREALGPAFDEACRLSLTGRANVEAFVPGRDVGLVSVVRGGRLYPITLIDELNASAADGAVRQLGIASPSIYSGKLEEERVHALARRVVSAFGIDTSAFMMACRLQPGGEPVLTEVHLDLGGDRILDALLPASAPFDVLSHLIECLTGTVPRLAAAPFRAAGLLFDSPSGPEADSAPEVEVASVPATHPRRDYRLVTARNRSALDAAMAGG